MSDSNVAAVEVRQSRSSMQAPVPPAITERPGGAAEVSPAKPADAIPIDPLRALIDKLDRAQPLVSRVDPALAAVVRNVTEKADQPSRLDDPIYRTRVAYLLQDMEKLVGPVAGVQPGLRDEMTRLAATAPGLQNERMQALVAMTASIDSKALVKDIRQSASDIVKAGDQMSADAQSKVDVLENKMRLSTRTLPPAEAASPGEGWGGTQRIEGHSCCSGFSASGGENGQSWPDSNGRAV